MRFGTAEAHEEGFSQTCLTMTARCRPPQRRPRALVPTPTDDELPRRYADFATMTEALDYAAQGERGLNFHDARATLVRVYPYAELRAGCARRAPIG